MRRLVLLGSTLTLLAALLSGSPAQAQAWEEVHMAPGVQVHDLFMLDDGLHGWAVGSEEAAGVVLPVVMRTTDGGQNWDSDLFPYSVTLNAVCFVSADQGWVACSGGLIYVSTDGGQTWTEQASGVWRSLNAISFVSETEGWITGGYDDGSSYLVLHTTDAGANWENQSFGNNCDACIDIVFSDPMHGWMCGSDSAGEGQIHHTSDGGETWARQTIPYAGREVSSITFVDNSIGWASTSDNYVSPAGPILGTRDGGNIWTIQGYTGTDYNFAIDAQDAQHVAITSSQILYPSQQIVVTTTDGGANWTARDVPMSSYSYGIQYVNDSIRLTGDESRVLRTDDLGITWETEDHAPWWQGIGWRDALTGWTVTVDNAGTNGFAWRTDDGGLSWQPDPDVPGGAQALFADESHGWMLMRRVNAPIWRTTDGGDTWTEHFIGGSFTEEVFFINEVRGWAHGSQGMIRRTDDGGQTWVAQSSGTSYFVAVVFFINANEGWAAGGYGGGNGFIRHTGNGGDTWETQTPASNGHFETGFFLDDQIGWLVDTSGSVHHTTNGGDTWQIIGGVSHDYIYEIFMESDLVGWLTAGNDTSWGNNGLGYIYKTEDGGVNWTQEWVTPWPRGWVSDISRQPGGPLWVCGAHSTLLVYASLPCVGDLDGDGDTDQADLGILLADWGCDDPVNGCVGDLNGDDKTDQADLGILLADWGCGT